MPYGQTRRIAPTNPDAVRVYPMTARNVPPAPPDAAERNAGEYDLWKADHLAAIDPAWPLISIEYASPATRLEVFAGAADALLIGLDRVPSNTPGGYDLWHPGGGQLVEIIPETRRIWITTTTGAAPAADVHVIAHGGAFASRVIS